MAEKFKYCRKCGAKASGQAIFCPSCGNKFNVITETPVKAVRYCGKCGKEISAEAKFCRYCGARSVAEQAKAGPVSQTKKTPEKQIMHSEKMVQAEKKAAAPASRPVNTKTRKFTGKRILAAVLAIAVFWVTAFKYPGFLVRDKRQGPGTSSSGNMKPGGSGPNSGKGKGSLGDAVPVGGSGDAARTNDLGTEAEKNAVTLTAEDLSFRYTQKQFENAPAKTAEVTPEQGTAVLGDIRVDIPSWELEDEGDRIEVREMPELSQGENGWSIRAYDFSLASGRHEFDSDIRIKIPREGISGFSGCVWYDEDSGKWQDIYSEVSEDGKYYTIYTDHFSLFGEKKYRFDVNLFELRLDNGEWIDLKHGVFIEWPLSGQNRMEAEVIIDYERMWNMYQNKTLDDVKDIGNSIARFTADPKEYDELTDGGYMPILDTVSDLLGLGETPFDAKDVAEAMVGRDTSGPKVTRVTNAPKGTNVPKGTKSPEKMTVGEKLGNTLTFIDIMLTSYKVYAEIKGGMRFNSYTTALGEALENNAFDIAGNTVGFAGILAGNAWNPVVAVAGLLIYTASLAYQDYKDGMDEWNTKYYPDEGEVYRRYYEDAGIRLYFDSPEIREKAKSDYHYAIMDKPANMDKKEFEELKKLVNERLNGIQTHTYKGFSPVFYKLIELYAKEPRMLEIVLDDFYHSVAWAIWKLPENSEKTQYKDTPEILFLKKYQGLGKDPFVLKRTEQLKLSEMYVMKMKIDSMQILENVAGRIHRKGCDELMRKIEKEFLPILNQKLIFRVVDGSLTSGQNFSDSDYCIDWQTINSNWKYRSLPDGNGSIFDEDFTAPIRFENVKAPKFLPLDLDGSVLSEQNYFPYTPNFIPRPEKNTNVVFRCTYFHYLMMGAPRRMIFKNKKTGKEVKVNIEIPDIDLNKGNRSTDVYIKLNEKKLEVPKINATLYYSDMKGTGKSAKDRSPENSVKVSPSGEVTISLAALNNYRITYETGAMAEKNYDVYNRPGMTLYGKVCDVDMNGHAYTSEISVGKIDGSGGFSKVKEPEKLIIMAGYLTDDPGGFEDRFTRYYNGKPDIDTLFKVKRVGIAPVGYQTTAFNYGDYSTFVIWQSKETGAVGAAIRFRGKLTAQYDGGEVKEESLRTIILTAADPCDGPDLFGW